MRLSVITDEISQDFGYALSVMSEYGVTGAELRGLWSTNIADLTAEQIDRAKKELVAAKMEVCALSTPILKCELEMDAATEGGDMHLAQARTLADQPELLRRDRKSVV